MKDFTVEYSKFGFYNEGNKKEIAEDNFSDKSFDEETIPDEEFNKTKKTRDKLPSCPSVEQKGPNINLKIQHKRYSNQKEKELIEKIAEWIGYTKFELLFRKTKDGMNGSAFHKK